MSLAVALICLLPATLGVQEPASEDVQKEIQALREAVTAIQKDVSEIKALLQGRQPAAPSQNVVLDLGRNPFRGEARAKLTLVEFSDFQCPYCGKHRRETWPQIEKEYVATGKVKYVLIDNPLSFHKLAFRAAEAAHCAGDQGKYWEMHDRLFANQKTLEPWKAHAVAIGLDVPGFESCMDQGRHAEDVRQDMAMARRAGVTGTPVSFLAYTEPDTTSVQTVVRVTGAQPFSAFRKQIEKLLVAKPAPKAASAAEDSN